MEYACTHVTSYFCAPFECNIIGLTTCEVGLYMKNEILRNLIIPQKIINK